MPRALWRRRRTTDTPRPGGRRWAGRLYRSRALARQVFRVRYRRRSRNPLTVAGDPLIVESFPHTSHRIRLAPSRPAPQPEPEAVPYRPPAGAAERNPRSSGPSLEGLRLLPGDRTMARQLRFLLVTCCTLASLSLGVLAILLAMRGDVRGAAVCLVGCVTLDGLDGLLARRLGVASPFGAQMDSLADMCAFGIAAPVVVYASVAGSVPAAAAAVASALVAACAAIRLARFNVCPKDSRFFTGVPTTLAAGVLALAVLIELPLPPTLLLLGVAVLAFAMVSSFPYATLARLLRLPPWVWLAPVAGALVDARLTFVALVLLYLASGPVLWFHLRLADRSSRTA